MKTCDDCMNYRTQHGRVWCRAGMTPPVMGAEACPFWNDADGPVRRGGRRPVAKGRKHTCDRCETLADLWLRGLLLREIAALTGRSISWISNAAHVHGWSARARGGSRV